MNRPSTLILAAVLWTPLAMAQSKYVTDVLALNPLGYWRLNGNANDATNNGNNGTLANGVTFTGPGLGAPIGDPNSQAAVLYTAQDQYISMPTTTSAPLFALDWFHPLTLMIWVKTTYTTNNRVILAKEEGSGNFRGFGISLDNGETGNVPSGAGRLAFFLQSTPSYGPGSGNFLAIESTASINDGNWHFLAATYDGSGQSAGMKLYMDGTPAATILYSTGNSLDGMSTLNNDVPVEIGARGPTDDRTFDGLLSEAAIFGTALTAAQIRQLENDTSSSPTTVLAQVAAGGPITTGFSVVNTGTQPANFSITFRDDNGNPLSLPFNGLGNLETLSDTIVAQGAKYYETSAPQAVIAASGSVTADPSITIQALFRRLGSDNSYYEAAVPTSSAVDEFVIPFDATTSAGTQIYTGIAIANLDPVNSANVACTARDSQGNVIPNAVTVPALNPLGHWANYLFPALTGQRGTLDCSSNTKIGSIGLRALGSALSSLPIIAIR